MDFTIASNRIFAEDQYAKLLAEVTFPLENENVVNINHTFVDNSLRGQGIAGQLMEEAIKVIRSNAWKAKPTCPYAVKWFEKHPEAHDVLAD